MRTNIVIDDKLMAAAMEAGGFKTKKEAVEEGLRLLARRKAYQGLRALRGRLEWLGDDSVDWSTIPADEPIPDLSVPEREALRARASKTQVKPDAAPRRTTARNQAKRPARRRAATA